MKKLLLIGSLLMSQLSFGTEWVNDSNIDEFENTIAPVLGVMDYVDFNNETFQQTLIFTCSPPAGAIIIAWKIGIRELENPTVLIKTSKGDVLEFDTIKSVGNGGLIPTNTPTSEANMLLLINQLALEGADGSVSVRVKDGSDHQTYEFSTANFNSSFLTFYNECQAGIETEFKYK